MECYILNISAIANTYFMGALRQIIHGHFDYFFALAWLALSYLSKLYIISLLIIFVIDVIHYKFLRKFVQRVIVLFSELVFICDLFSLIMYHHLFDKPMMRVLLETNLRESIEFVKTYGVYIFFSIVVSIVVIGLIYIVLHFFMRYKGKSSKLIVTLAGINCLLLVMTGICAPRLLWEYQISSERIITMIPKVYQENREYMLYFNSMNNHAVELTRNDSSIPNVVIILGESTTRNHMGLYGYSLQTTPLLQKRKDLGELYAFKDVISPDTYTNAVLKKIFTFYRSGDSREWYSYTNILDIVNTAGYTTHWFSNQESSGIGGDIGLAYASRCNEKKYISIRDSRVDWAMDSRILPILDDSIGNMNKKNFYILHLMGTHFNYRSRYPEEYNHFSIEDESADDDEIKKIRAEYDNAVLYDDFIVNEIIKRFEDKNTIIIFISDHGDDVADEEKNNAGHRTKGNFRMMEIPMIIWTSAQFKLSYPEITQRIANSTERPFMTDDLIHVILDIMQIETSDYDASKSVINESYNIERKRIYEGVEYSHGPTPEF